MSVTDASTILGLVGWIIKNDKIGVTHNQTIGRHYSEKY